jgi:hypothetical protein
MAAFRRSSVGVGTVTIRRFLVRFIIAFAASPWVFVLSYFGHRCFDNRFSDALGTVPCLLSYVQTAPLYMIFDGIAHEDSVPPYGLLVWLLTALLLTLGWLLVSFLLAQFRGRDSISD